MGLNTRQVLPESYNLSRSGVLRTAEGLRSPHGMTIDKSFFTANSEGNIIIPDGYAWVRLAGGLARVLPITKTKSAVLTTSNKVTVHCASIFKVGEILQVQSSGAAIGVIQSINADTNEITLAANAVTAAAIGVPIHVAGTAIARPTTPSGPGIIGFNFSYLNLAEYDDVALYVSASVYGDRMPQFVPALMALFPEIAW